jgi:hypothetical protein
MKLITVPRHYILTTEGYVPLVEFCESPNDFILKSYLFEAKQIQGQTVYVVSRIDYGYADAKLEKLDEKININGLKIFRGCLNVNPIEDVLVFTTKGYKQYDKLVAGDVIVTVIKHMVTEIMFDGYCRCHPKHIVHLNALDLPSITLSMDESGTSAITLFNAKQVLGVQ